ncbi:MAG: hypothetical protein OEW60_03155 [Thiovulaceae bacterium]|nr:hypothetical protein [Sulfurimonadaceae bacterium]
MSSTMTLLKMIQKEVLPEIEEHMDELMQIVASNQVTDEDKEALKETQELQQEFKELLEELEAGDLEEDEVLELIEGIKEMRAIED